MVREEVGTESVEDVLNEPGGATLAVNGANVSVIDEDVAGA